MLPLVKPSRSNKRDNLSLKINTDNTEPIQGLEQFPLIQSRTNSSNSSKNVDSPVLNSLENLLVAKSTKSHVPSRSISGGYSYNKSALHSSGTDAALSSGSSLFDTRAKHPNSARVPTSSLSSSMLNAKEFFSPPGTSKFPTSPHFFYSEYDSKLSALSPKDNPSNFMRRKSLLNSLSKSSTNSLNKTYNLNHELCKKALFFLSFSQPYFFL
ncbi:hypothetical protein AYI69_g629 [Smittium culicis]|uniref:Uncharacterized protein n=1 Tax=Smittium culicis TaxID=133412 RepID=A0A1R1YSK5_9FUNG|nr:hypothetical protein AYI69_g629 [Smittium culicis]